MRIRFVLIALVAVVPATWSCSKGPQRPSDLEYLWAQYRCYIEHLDPAMDELDSLLFDRRYSEAADLAAASVDFPDECVQVSDAFDVAVCSDLEDPERFYRGDLSVERCETLRARYLAPSSEPEPRGGRGRLFPGDDVGANY